ncbi:MAG: hypothetical protein ABI658_00805 [Acidimicrobiales bacterium]
MTQPYQAPNPLWVAPDAEPGGTEALVGPADVVPSGTISAERVRQLRLRQRSDTTFPVRLRPMRLVDVMDGAFAVLKSQPRAVTLLLLPMVLPVSLLQAYLGRGSGNASIVEFFSSPGRFGRIVNDQGWSAIVYLLDLMVLSISGALMGKMLALWFEGKVPDAAVVLRASGRIVPRALAAFVLVHLIEAVAAVGLGVGTLLVIPLVSLTSPVIGIENIGPVAAVRRSWALTRRHYKHTCAFALFGASVVFLLGVLFGWLPSTIAAGLGDDGYGWVVVGLASVMFATITTAFIAIAAVIFYLDLRVRSEGMDIEILASELFPQ